MFADRVLSGMRPTGRMHLGHYHGALKNWVRLQEEYECLYFAADWHALTTHYDTPETIAESVWEMFVDWLAVGINPNRATIFIQSRVPEHAELALLLGMIAPIGWLERVPTYKDQQEKLSDRDLSTYGFLGYPVMQAADILVYRANMVPVGEDQVSHLEVVRELARRFNHLYGREAGFDDKAKAAIRKLGSTRPRISPWATASACSATSRGRAASSCPSRRRCSPKRPRCRGSTGRRCRSPTATPSCCARSPRRSSARYAPCRPTRRGCIGPIRGHRKNARCGRCTRSIPTRRYRPGYRRAAPRPASAASSASNRCSRPSSPNRSQSGSGRRSTSTIRRWYGR